MITPSRANFAIAVLMVVAVVLFGLGQGLSYESQVPFINIIHFATTSHQSGDIVINDAGTWAKLWNATICGANCSSGEAAPPPVINFSNTTLLAVFANPNPVGALPNPDVINITGVFQTQQGLQVEVTVIKCWPNCVFINFGPPGWAPGGGEFQIVTVPKTTGPVTFSTHTITRSCPEFTRITGFLCE